MENRSTARMGRLLGISLAISSAGNLFARVTAPVANYVSGENNVVHYSVGTIENHDYGCCSMCEQLGDARVCEQFDKLQRRADKLKVSKPHSDVVEKMYIIEEELARLQQNIAQLREAPGKAETLQCEQAAWTVAGAVGAFFNLVKENLPHAWHAFYLYQAINFLHAQAHITQIETDANWWTQVFNMVTSVAPWAGKLLGVW